jgi:hypothetical protein
MKFLTVGGSKEEAIAVANAPTKSVGEPETENHKLLRFGAYLLGATGISFLINRVSEQRRKRDPWAKFVRDAHDDRNYRDDR